MAGNPEDIAGEKIQKVLIADPSTGNSVSAQYPLPTDGDSVHAKDVDIPNSIMGDFSGKPTDFFDDLHSENVDLTGNNPKLVTIHFNRTLVSPLIGIGSSEGGNFSNVKIIAIVSGGIEFPIFDNSGDNTKRTTQFFQFPNAGFNAVRIEFHTIDTISLTNIYMPKVVSVSATIETSVVFAASYNGVLLANPLNSSTDMNVDGSITPVDFVYEVTGLTRALWHRSFIELTDGNQAFLSDNFGAIAGGLTNGVDIIVLRNGVEKVLETWKTNMDISLTMFDFNSPYRQGEYIGRWTLPSDIGSPISLFEGDKIIFRVRDDLLTLDSFRNKIKVKQ